MMDESVPMPTQWRFKRDIPRTEWLEGSRKTEQWKTGVINFSILSPSVFLCLLLVIHVSNPGMRWLVLRQVASECLLCSASVPLTATILRSLWGNRFPPSIHFILILVVPLLLLLLFSSANPCFYFLRGYTTAPRQRWTTTTALKNNKSTRW